MGGAISSVGKFFDSDLGRVVAGVATGGTSEVGRAAAGTARRSGVDPTIAAVLGARTSGALGENAAKPLVPTAGTNQSPDVTAPPITASASLAASDREAVTKAGDLQRETLAATDAARTKAEADLAARTETPQEALEARRRAAASQTGAGGKRRASQFLTNPGTTLSGVY